VDVDRQENLPVHPRIEYLNGSSASPEIIARLQKQIRPEDKVIAFLDSDHRKPHVLAELHAYSKLVTPGSYLVVEDSNVNGHPVFPKFGPGPTEAMEEFLAENRNFAADKSREKFFVTFNPRGYLKRIR
jgi:cephalosporin hydroxylase